MNAVRGRLSSPPDDAAAEAGITFGADEHDDDAEEDEEDEEVDDDDDDDAANDKVRMHPAAAGAVEADLADTSGTSVVVDVDDRCCDDDAGCLVRLLDLRDRGPDRTHAAMRCG